MIDNPGLVFPTPAELEDREAEQQALFIRNLRESLRSYWQSVLLDGRNEFGSHVLPMPGNNIPDGEVEKELGEQAERIISNAESLGYEIGQVVVTIWSAHDDGDGSWWEYEHIDSLLTEFLHGNAAEQRERLRSIP